MQCANCTRQLGLVSHSDMLGRRFCSTTCLYVAPVPKWLQMAREVRHALSSLFSWRRRRRPLLPCQDQHQRNRAVLSLTRVLRSMVSYGLLAVCERAVSANTDGLPTQRQTPLGGTHAMQVRNTTPRSKSRARRLRRRWKSYLRRVCEAHRQGAALPSLPLQLGGTAWLGSSGRHTLSSSSP